jgi:hypothetical protein
MSSSVGAALRPTLSDDEEHEVPSQSFALDHFDAEEVDGRDCSPMSFQERFPGHSPPADRIESVLEKDPLDRIPVDFMPAVIERTSNSGVAPARVLTSHPEDQIADFSRGSRTAGPSAIAAVVLSRDQLPMPSKESIGSHQGLDLGEPFSADLPGLRGETPALVVSESQSLSIYLLPQGSILLLEIVDHVLLMAAYPASEDQHQKLQRQSVHRTGSRPIELGAMDQN